MAQLPQNIDALTLIVQTEEITARGETPIFQVLRRTFHGGGYAQKIGACQQHLSSISGARGNYQAPFSDYLRVLRVLDDDHNKETRLVGVVPAGTKHSNRCPLCPYKALPE